MSDIPLNAPVLIHNKHADGYLVRTGSYDSERNNVGIEEDLSSVSSSYNTKWNMVSSGGQEYQIILHGSNEPLYAASNNLAYDNERRRVFTWKNKGSVTQGYWNLEKQSDGYYMIKNTQHGEYLYAADHPKGGSVFTWREYNQSWVNNKFLWQLVRA